MSWFLCSISFSSYWTGFSPIFLFRVDDKEAVTKPMKRTTTTKRSMFA